MASYFMKDCELLNLGDRPEKLIMTEIAVPPVPIRPSVFVAGGRMSNEDSITVILKSIANTNSILKETLQNSGQFMKCFVRCSTGGLAIPKLCRLRRRRHWICSSIKQAMKAILYLYLRRDMKNVQ